MELNTKGVLLLIELNIKAILVFNFELNIKCVLVLSCELNTRVELNIKGGLVLVLN